MDNALGCIKFLFPPPRMFPSTIQPAKRCSVNQSRLQAWLYSGAAPAGIGKVLLLDDRNNPIDGNVFDHILAKGEAAPLQFKESVPAIHLCSTTHVIEEKVRFKPDLY